MNTTSNYSDHMGHMSELQPLQYYERLVVAVFYVVVATFGTVGNLLVILAIAFSGKLQTHTNAFVLSLGIADLTVSVMQPLQVVGLLSNDGWPLSAEICELAGSVIVISVTSSVITLALISINRHCLITRSQREYLNIYQPRNMVVMISFAWLIPITVLILPQAIGYGQLGYDKYTHLCAWDFEHHLVKFYQITAAVIGVLAYSIILVCYWLIYQYLKKHSVSLQKHANKQVNRINRKVRINVKITKNLFYVVCVYMVCVVPYSLCLLFISKNNPRARHASLYLALILVMNSCANVIIYGLKHPHFRVVFTCIARCNLTDIPMPSRFLKFLFRKSFENSSGCVLVSDRPVNLASDTWASNSMKKKRLSIISF